MPELKQSADSAKGDTRDLAREKTADFLLLIELQKDEAECFAF